MISLVPHGSGTSKSNRLGDDGGSRSTTSLLNIPWPQQQQPRPPPSSSRRRRFAPSVPRRRTPVGMVFVAGCFAFPASPDAVAAAFVVPTAVVQVRGIANNTPERGGGGTRSNKLRETNSDGSREPESPDDDETTRESLRETLSYIEALEERNKAQLGSFVDEADQWDSLEDFEKELLLSKPDLEKQLDELLGKQEEISGDDTNNEEWSTKEVE